MYSTSHQRFSTSCLIHFQIIGYCLLQSYSASILLYMRVFQKRFAKGNCMTTKTIAVKMLSMKARTSSYICIFFVVIIPKLEQYFWDSSYQSQKRFMQTVLRFANPNIALLDLNKSLYDENLSRSFCNMSEQNFSFSLTQ